MEHHLDEAWPLMHYLKIIRNMARVFPPAVWFGYDREFRILWQHHPSLPWNVLHPQIYFQQIAKVSPYGPRGYDNRGFQRDKGVSDFRNSMVQDSATRQGEQQVFGHVHIIIYMALVDTLLNVHL